MFEELKKRVYKANMELNNQGVVIYTWGNVSEIDRELGVMAIKPSGVDYEKLLPEDIVVVDLSSGEKVEGTYKPSSDTDTHLNLYRHFSMIGGIAHTHSPMAVAFAQAGMSITALGSTHADYFHGDIPCTRALSFEEISDSYEQNTGKVIVETVGENDSLAIPAVLVKSHGPFTWGANADEAVYNAVVLEQVAKMATYTFILQPNCKRIPQSVLDKHYFRKHGKNAYYGQKH